MIKNDEENNNSVCDPDFVSIGKSRYLQNKIKENVLIEETKELFPENEFEVISNSSSNMSSLLEEFTEIYSEKMKRTNGSNSSNEDELKKKISILENWVSDLRDQNSVLVSTVQDLEKEAGRRVSLLQEKLDQMAIATRESCVSLRDHQLQVTSLVKQKLSAEDELKDLQDKFLSLEGTNSCLLQENSSLRQDLDSAGEVISQGRISESGNWERNDVSFSSLRPDQLLGLQQPTSLSSMSPQNQEACLDFQQRILVDATKIRKCSLNSSLSSDTDETSIPKLKLENKHLKKLQNETNDILIQRDKHIAELQAQLTGLHHKLAATQSQVDNTTTTLHNLLDRGRHDSFEISRRDDVIRQLLSPTRRFNSESTRSLDHFESKHKINAEIELGENIDVMASRLADLEDECQQLKHQNSVLSNSHNQCSSNMEDIRDQLADTQNALVQVKLQLRDCKHKEMQLSDEIETKEEVIKRLRMKAENKEDEQKNIKKSFSSSDFKNIQTQTDQSEFSQFHLDRRKEIEDSAKITKLENELSEKNVLLRELQKHLVLSREELRIKDETLYNIEQKLNASRHSYDEKEERMLYLTSQLTNLQLEVSRLHGNSQQLRMQLENKSELVLKLECENRSLVRQLNEKSSYYEGIQKEFSHLLSNIERKEAEISEQKMTIGTLQDALIATKITCDKLRSQFEPHETKNCGNHRSRTRPQRKNQKGRACSCRRAKSYHSQEELQIIELRYIIDELSNYLEDAEKMALTVERERELLHKKIIPDQHFFLREFCEQRDSLNKIRNDGSMIMSKLLNMREEISKCTSVEDFRAKGYYFRPSSLSPVKKSKQTPEEFENYSVQCPTNSKSDTQPSSLKKQDQRDLDFLLTKVSNLESEFHTERTCKNPLSGNADAVVSTVQQWLDFQKVVNPNLEDKFNHLKETPVLLKETPNLQHLQHGSNCSKTDAFPNTTKLPRSSRTQQLESPNDQEDPLKDSLTNDTGIEEASFLSSPKTRSALAENCICKQASFNYFAPHE